MRTRWKALSERADNQAFSPEDVAEAFGPALLADWAADVSDSFLKLLRQALMEGGASLFPDQAARDI